jgi:5-methylcytosine-specific restriction endonuclease McrA
MRRFTAEQRIKKAAADKVYAQEHAEEIHAYQAQWRAENVEKRRAYAKAYGEKHTEKLCKRARDWYANHDEQAKETRKAWRQDHPESKKASDDKRKAKQRGASEITLTAAQWQIIKAHYGHRCVYCGKKSQHLTQDHITPLSKGGAHTLQNIAPACISCNARKHTNPPPIPVQPLLL